MVWSAVLDASQPNAVAGFAIFDAGKLVEPVVKKLVAVMFDALTIDW